MGGIVEWWTEPIKELLKLINTYSWEDSPISLMEVNEGRSSSVARYQEWIRVVLDSGRTVWIPTRPWNSGPDELLQVFSGVHRSLLIWSTCVLFVDLKTHDCVPVVALVGSSEGVHVLVVAATSHLFPITKVRTVSASLTQSETLFQCALSGSQMHLLSKHVCDTVCVGSSSSRWK